MIDYEANMGMNRHQFRRPLAFTLLRYLVNMTAAMLLIVAVAYADGQTPAVAWWYGITFVADQDVVQDVRVDHLDPTWAKARALSTHDLIGKVSKQEIAKFKKSPFRFSVISDLNKDGKSERILVGVYKRKDGSEGEFLAIFGGGVPLKVFSRDGNPGFSAILKYKGAIRWYSCMECSEFETVLWSGANYVLE